MKKEEREEDKPQKGEKLFTPPKESSNLEANSKKTVQNNSEGLKEHNKKILFVSGFARTQQSYPTGGWGVSQRLKRQIRNQSAKTVTQRQQVAAASSIQQKYYKRRAKEETDWGGTGLYFQRATSAHTPVTQTCPGVGSTPCRGRVIGAHNWEEKYEQWNGNK